MKAVYVCSGYPMKSRSSSIFAPLEESLTGEVFSYLTGKSDRLLTREHNTLLTNMQMFCLFSGTVVLVGVFPLFTRCSIVVTCNQVMHFYQECLAGVHRRLWLGRLRGPRETSRGEARSREALFLSFAPYNWCTMKGRPFCPMSPNDSAQTSTAP
jgi:hypothetical protein